MTDKQKIKVGDFTIQRFDANNWAVTKKGDTRKFFYGRLIHALQGLPHKMLNEAEMQDLKQIKLALEGIYRNIDRLYSEKFEHLK